jgi:hypothetical protein
VSEKITNEELLYGKALAAELEAAKSKAEAKAAQFELHIARLSRKYCLDEGDGMTEDGTIVRAKKNETTTLESVK